MKSKAAVVGLVPNQHDEADAGSAHLFHRFADELAAIALAVKFGINGKRPEQGSMARAANRHFGQADRRDQSAIEIGGAAEARRQAFAFSHTIGRARETSGSEHACVQSRNGSRIVRRDRAGDDGQCHMLR